VAHSPASGNEGFEATLNAKAREAPARQLVFDGEQEAKVIVLPLGPPPKGFANWSSSWKSCRRSASAGPRARVIPEHFSHCEWLSSL
jgi:hypothetical protein